MLMGREGNGITNTKLPGEYFGKDRAEADDHSWLVGIAVSDTLF